MLALRRELERAQIRIGQLEIMLRRYKRMLARDDAARRAGNVTVWSPEEKALHYEALDHAMASVSQHERELFEASPAYAKYQQWRATRAIVKNGDWRAP
jgi:hypothetical protein